MCFSLLMFVQALPFNIRLIVLHFLHEEKRLEEIPQRKSTRGNALWINTQGQSLVEECAKEQYLWKTSSGKLPKYKSLRKYPKRSSTKEIRKDDTQGKYLSTTKQQQWKWWMATPNRNCVVVGRWGVTTFRCCLCGWLSGHGLHFFL